MIALASALEGQLRELGESRERLRAEEAKLASDTKRLVQRARDRGANMTLVAALVGLDRTYLYRSYL